MSVEPKSQFSKDADALERTCMNLGYRHAVKDLEDVLREEMSGADNPESMRMILRIQTAIYQMEEVRFPRNNQN